MKWVRDCSFLGLSHKPGLLRLATRDHLPPQGSGPQHFRFLPLRLRILTPKAMVSGSGAPLLSASLGTSSSRLIAGRDGLVAACFFQGLLHVRAGRCSASVAELGQSPKKLLRRWSRRPGSGTQVSPAPSKHTKSASCGTQSMYSIPNRENKLYMHQRRHNVRTCV